MMNTLPFDKDKLLDKYKPDFAAGYGSGVFLQEGYDKNEKPMIDLIFGVDSPRERHKENLNKNPEDYSALVRLLGARFANYLQDKGAKLYYNPYIEFEDCTIKYGVISKESLIKDFRLWDRLYAAGRFHKPVHILQENEDIQQAMEVNFTNAVHTALLLLPETFTEEQLYETIAGISYTGDHRMKRGENPNKVHNIVSKNMEGFQKLYRHIIASKGDIITALNDNQFQQDIHPDHLKSLHFKLPRNLLIRTNVEAFTSKDAVVNEVKRGIVSIVKSTSQAQSNKGILTAGLVKSVKYVRAKLKKAKGT